jgi:hypothetical protein
VFRAGWIILPLQIFFFAQTPAYSVRRGKSDPVYREIRSKTVQHQKTDKRTTPKAKDNNTTRENTKTPQSVVRDYK